MVTGLDGTTGSVSYTVQAPGDVSVVLRDADGRTVARAAGSTGLLSVPDVHPWAPGDGYLYELEVSAGDDEYLLGVGIRTVEVRGSEFLINGKPFYFTGFGKHEDAAIRGKQHDDVMMVHDFELLRWMGANSFRTSHYPYAEEVYDYACPRQFRRCPWSDSSCWASASAASTP